MARSPGLESFFPVVYLADVDASVTHMCVCVCMCSYVQEGKPGFEQWHHSENVVGGERERTEGNSACRNIVFEHMRRTLRLLAALVQ